MRYRPVTSLLLALAVLAAATASTIAQEPRKHIGPLAPNAPLATDSESATSAGNTPSTDPEFASSASITCGNLGYLVGAFESAVDAVSCVTNGSANRMADVAWCGYQVAAGHLELGQIYVRASCERGCEYTTGPTTCRRFGAVR